MSQFLDVTLVNDSEEKMQALVAIDTISIIVESKVPEITQIHVMTEIGEQELHAEMTLDEMRARLQSAGLLV